MMPAAQFTPCPPLCTAVCDLSERSGYSHHRGSLSAIWADFETANFQQDKGPESVSPRPAHFCPQCGQFREPGSGVGKTGMGTVLGTVNEKSQCFPAFQGCRNHKNQGSGSAEKVVDFCSEVW